MKNIKIIQMNNYWSFKINQDEESAKILHFNNRRRVLRAIEIYETTGKRKSEMLEEQEHICLYDAYFVGLTLPRWCFIWKN